MADSVDDRFDRYLAGELSAPEQRDLAQAALDHPELFDALTAAAIMKATVLRVGSVNPAVEVEPTPVVGAAPALFRPKKDRFAGWFRDRPFTLSLAGVLGAAAVVTFAVVYRAPSNPIQPRATSEAAAAAPGEPPADARPASPASRPVLLVARLDALDRQPADTFRASATDSRAPKSEGVIVSVDGGEAAVDLGALDGLAKGSRLAVFRGGDRGSALGELTIVTVFRERSRGRATSSSGLQAGDRVEVAPAIHLSALLEQISARLSAGDTATARSLAERATTIAQAPGIPGGSRRQAFDRLGTLEHRAGALEDAERHLRSAVGNLDAAPMATRTERGEILNELAAVLIERGNYSDAEPLLARAQSEASGAVGVHVANNRAALAALRGDPTAAESLYRSALALAANEPGLDADRRAVEANLERLSTPR